MSMADLPPWADELINSARVARLGLVDDRDRPRVLPLTFALADGAIWSAIDHKPKRTAEPARIRWLRRRPEVTLLVDVYSDDWEQLAWVQLLGRIEILERERAGDGLAALAAKYPQYHDDLPTGPFLRFEVERAIWWRAEL